MTMATTGWNPNEQCVLEDFAPVIGWLKTYTEQAGVTLTPEVVRATLPPVMDWFGYDVDSYSDDVLAIVAKAVACGAEK